MKRTAICFGFIALAVAALSGCNDRSPSADQIQAAAQERILQEGTAQTGMPAITNFRERKTLKMIYELRDKENLATYTYIIAQQSGRPTLLCSSIGFAISDATGYTNPLRIHERNTNMGYAIMPQAEPNGLFTPETSNTNWVICVDSKGNPTPTQVQGDILVTTYELPK